MSSWEAGSWAGFSVLLLSRTKGTVLWRSPLCGAEPGALHQSLVALTFP